MKQRFNLSNGFFKKKFVRILSKTLLTLVVFIYLLTALLNTSLFQTVVANVASEFFSQQWKTKMRISALSIDIFRGVKIHDIYLEDQHKDTILAANSIRVAFDFFPLNNGLNVSSVSLKDVTFNLSKKGDTLNFRFIIDYFKSNKPKDTTEKKPFIINVGHLSMQNVNFLLDVDTENEGLFAQRVNPRKQKYTNINAEISNIKVIKDSILCDIENFEAKEHSGFVLTNLKGKVTASKSVISVQDMTLITPHTKLYADCKLYTTDWKTYSHYVDSVKMDVVLKKQTLLGGKDATYWAESMKGFTESFFVSGKVKGTVADMQIDDLDIKKHNTHIAATGHIKGLPYIDSTIFDLQIDNISSSYADFKSFNLGEIGKRIDLPPMLSNIGAFVLQGKVNGGLKEFNAKALLATEAGSFDLIAMGQYDKTTEQTIYAADVNAIAVNVGDILNNDIIGTTDMSAKVTLSGTDFKKNMKANAVVNFNYLDINNNVYNSISLNGNLNSGKANAEIRIDDKDIVLAATAFADLSNSKNIRANIKANIDNADLAQINFFRFADSNAIVSANIEADVRNIDLKHLDASVDITNFKVRNTENDFALSNLFIDMSPIDSVSNELRIQSDVMNFNMKGSFNLSEIGKDFSYAILQYLPQFKEDNEIKQKHSEESAPPIIQSDVVFNAKFKDVTPLLNLFVPIISLSDKAELSGVLNEKDKLQFNFTTDQLALSNIALKNISLDCNETKGRLDINLTSSCCFLSDSLYMPSPKANIKIAKDRIDLALQFTDTNDNNNEIDGAINFNILVDGQSMHGSFANSYFNILNRKININNNNLIAYNGEKISLMNLLFFNDKETIKLSGDISKSLSDVLNIKFDNVDISLVNIFLKGANTTLEGCLNDSLSVKALLDKPVFTSNLRIDSLKLNNTELGYAWLNIKNSYNAEGFYADIKILKQNSTQNLPLSLKGNITPVRNKKETNILLDMNLAFKDLNIGFVQNYLSTFSSRFGGKLFADNIHIGGTIKQPDISGNLFVKDGVVKIDILNTTYFFNDTIHLNNNTFNFNNFIFKDEQKNNIVLNGAISHKEFKDYDIHLNALADKIKILNTKASVNTKYYGTAFASAAIKLDGNLDMLDIDIKAKTEKGTTLTVPVSSKMSAKENDFIQFVSHTSIDSVSSEKNVREKSMKTNITMDLNVTPDAMISVPMNFKEITGNLSATPDGDLKIDLDDNGNIRMFGNVSIDNGNFKMGLLSAVERNFVLQKGSYIQFTGGSPTDAQLDVQAIYKTKSSLALLGDGYNRKTDVDCIVKLSGSLTDPNPTFDIQLPNTDQQTTDQLFNALNLDKNNSESMFMQVAYLMISNSFYQDGGNIATNFNESYLGNSAFDALFSQVNSKVSDILNVDFKAGVEMGNDENMGNSINAGISKDFGKWSINLSSSFMTDSKQTENANVSSLGTFEGSVEYHITDNFVLHGYNKSNKDDFEKAAFAPYTQGIGLQYRRQYRKFSDIFRKKRKNTSSKDKIAFE
ncbi:MAG: translocation/assembly module TamB [Bacteroidales bacterium]|jgi:hypothetical protein|nr:translocation/assembly module TamB [Bacteroidales bacterium]